MSDVSLAPSRLAPVCTALGTLAVTGVLSALSRVLVGQPNDDATYGLIVRPPTDGAGSGLKVLANNQTQSITLGWGGITCSAFMDFSAGGRLAFFTQAGVVLYGENSAQRVYVGGAQADDGSAAALQVAGATSLSNVAGTPSHPATGGVLFVQAGALKYVGSSGTVTTLASA